MDVNTHTDEMVGSSDFSHVITANQLKRANKQYLKDRLYEVLYKLKMRQIGPKLRGGIFAVNRSDMVRLNGFDENYQGWGNEDDDLCYRLYASGVRGVHAVVGEYSIHQYHPPFRAAGERVNKEYFDRRRKEILNGDWYCTSGILNEGEEYSDVVVRQYKT